MFQPSDSSIQTAEFPPPDQISYHDMFQLALDELGESRKGDKGCPSNLLMPRVGRYRRSDSELLNSNQKQVANKKLIECMLTTQKAMTPFVKFPKLRLCYLERPPFLFVHDVVTSVIRTHGLLSGLFTSDEADRTMACQSRIRIRFYKKLLAALKSTTGEPFPEPNWPKLIKGALPFYSNWILQTIGYALEKRMSSDLAVKKINQGANYSPFLYCYSDCWKTESTEPGKSGLIGLINHKRKSNEELNESDLERSVKFRGQFETSQTSGGSGGDSGGDRDRDEDYYSSCDEDPGDYDAEYIEGAQSSESLHGDGCDGQRTSKLATATADEPVDMDFS